MAANLRRKCDRRDRRSRRNHRAKMLRETLLSFAGASGEVEVHTAIIVGLRRSGEVKISQRNLLSTCGCKAPQSLTHYRVVLNFLAMLIPENQNRRRGRSFRADLLVRGCGRVRACIHILIFCATCSLLFEALLIHFVGRLELARAVFIVGRMRIPPPPIPPRIIAAVPPRPAPAAAEAEVPEAPVAETIAAETITAEAGSTELTLTKARPMKGRTAAESWAASYP